MADARESKNLQTEKFNCHILIMYKISNNFYNKYQLEAESKVRSD